MRHLLPTLPSLKDNSCVARPRNLKASPTPPCSQSWSATYRLSGSSQSPLPEEDSQGDPAPAAVAPCNSPKRIISDSAMVHAKPNKDQQPRHAENPCKQIFHRSRLTPKIVVAIAQPFLEAPQPWRKSETSFSSWLSHRLGEQPCRYEFGLRRHH